MYGDKSKFNDYTIDFGETKVIWHHFTPYIVPEEMTVQEEMYLLASQQTLFCGNTSVDNILKNQFKDYEKIIKNNQRVLQKRDLATQKKKLINDTLKGARKIYKSVQASLENIDLMSRNAALNTSIIIFKRMYASIGACRFLIKYGYLFESYAIQRQILEQVAFAYHISKTSTVEEVIDPPRCITELKQFYKEAGYIYGTLSKRTHISLDQLNLYFNHNKTSGESTLTYTSLEYSLKTLCDFLKILDIYCCTFEYCFNQYLVDKKIPLLYVTRQQLIKKNRPTQSLENKYKKKYKQFAKDG